MLEIFVLGMGIMLGYLVTSEIMSDYYKAEIQELKDALAEKDSI